MGCSTGGFTDCLLQNGAKKVYALDVGHNQLVYKLRNDKRVVSIEDFNAKNIKKEMFEENISVIVSDVSFISITKIAPVIYREFENFEFWISLIKPQFEAEKSEIPELQLYTMQKPIQPLLFLQMEEISPVILIR